MAPVSLLYAVALAAYLYLAVLVLVRNPKSLLNWTCAAFLLSLAVWGLEDVSHGNPHTALEQTAFFSDIGNLGRATFASLFLLFALVFTGRQRSLRRPLTWLGLAGPPLVFIWALWSGRFLPESVHHPFGWVVVWPWTVWSVGYYVWYIMYIACAISLLLKYRRTATSASERAQAVVLLVTIALSVLLGTVTDVVLPNLTEIHFPELAGFFGLIWAVGLYYAVTRFGLMPAVPGTAADDILTTMLDSVLLLDLKGRVTAANRAAQDAFGFGLDEMRGKPGRVLFAAGEAFDRLMDRVAVSGAVSSVPLEVRSVGGRQFRVSASVRVMRGRGGKPAGTVWVLRDLTEQERTAQAVHETEEKYRAFIENFPGIAFRADLDFELEFLHGTVERTSGYAESEFTSGTVRWRDLIHPDDIERLRQGSAKLRTVPGSSITRDYRIRRKDGGTCWIRERAWNVSDLTGAPVRLHGVLFDVTEHHRALDELSSLSQFRESVIDSASVWMMVTDTQMRVLIWNKAAERISGYLRDEVVGTRAVWERLYPDPEFRVRLKNQGRPVVEQGGEVQELETPIVCRNGQRKTVTLTFRPVVSPDGTVTAIAILGRDVTEQRQAEAALRESEEKYRNVVERANDGIVIIQDGVVKYANPWLIRLGGYDESEITGSEFSKFIAPAELPRVVERYRRRMAGEPVPSTYETVMELKNGTTLHAELNAGLITYNGRPADLVIVRDITERRLAEERDARHLRHMTFLTRTAIELVNLTPDDDLYLLIAERLKELAGALLVFVNSYEGPKRLIRTRAAVGLGPFAERAVQLLGRNPVGMTYPLSDEAAATLALGRLAEIKGGLYALSFGTIPKVVCDSLEKLFGIGAAYSIGFAWNGALFGNATIIMRSGETVAPPSVVETLVRQASIALQRRRTEEALHESEENFRSLADNAHDGILIVNGKGCHVYANPSAAGLFGVPPGQLAGTNFREFLSAADQAALSDRLARRLRGEKVPSQYEVEMIRRDGVRVPVEITGARTVWRGQPAVLVIVRDVNERRLADLRLKETSERYRALFENSPISLWEEDFSLVRARFSQLQESGVRDFGTYFRAHPEEVAHCAGLVKILNVNEATIRLYKAKSKSDLLANLANVFDEESYPVFADELAALAAGGIMFESAAVNRTLKGERLHVMLRCVVAPGCEETLSRMLVSVVDIAELKKAESALRRAGRA